MPQTPNGQDHIFARALEKPADQRAAFLDGACGHDHALRAQIEELLECHEEAGTFLQNPPEGLREAADYQPLREGPGTVIGRYKLLQQIGEGGFGVVFMAEQQVPVKRRVALKIIKPGMDTKDVIARFEAERQALALMDYPNIAKVLDAGATESGRPYFVMELVKGVPLTQFCDHNNLSTHDRLELFVTVCRAVQHAHQKGVIHRDLKPSNVMISMHGGKPVPVIIDFGVSKAISQQLTDKTLFTAYGQMVGTPAYMSPEQAEMSRFDVDTRSDIYSLGVERLRGTAYAEMQQLIRDSEAPKPSTRLSTLGDALATIAKQRNTDPKRLRQFLRGDLDWIVMKALEKERERRYDTANSLANDVGRFLRDESVEARPPSIAYKLRKFARRNKGAVMAGVALAAAVLLGIIGTTTGMIRANRQAEQARMMAHTAGAEKARADKSAKDLRRTAEDLSRRLYASLIARASTAIRDDKLEHADSLLEACPERLRHWEWLHLKRRARPTRLLRIGGMAGSLYTRDGRRIITAGWRSGPATRDGRPVMGTVGQSASDERNVKFWDAATGDLLRTLPGHEANVSSLALSRDGMQLVTASTDGTLILWNTQTWQRVWREPNAHSQRIDALAFSPDGAAIASVSWDGTLKVWDAENREPRLNKTLGYRLGGVAFSPDGDRIVSSANFGSDGPTTLWDAITGSEVLVLQDQGMAAGAVAFSPNGRWILTGSTSGMLTVWNADTGARLRQQAGHAGAVLALAYSPNGNEIASGGADFTVKLWDAVTLQKLATLGAHDWEVHRISFSPDGTSVASFCPGDGIRVWDGARSPDVLTLRGHEGDVVGVAFSPTGSQIASAGGDGTVRLWDAASGQEVSALHGHEAPVINVAYHPGGRMVATGDEDGIVKLWDTATGKETRVLRSHQDRVRSVAFSPDGSHLATTGDDRDDRNVRVWRVASGNLVHTLEGHTDDVNMVAYSPDGKWIASACDDDTVKLWDAGTGRILRTLHRSSAAEDVLGGAHGDVEALAFSPGGEQIALGCGDGTIELWNPATGEVAESLSGRSGHIRSVVFSSDAQRVFSGADDQTISVWNPVTGEELLVLRGHEGGVTALAVSPDGNTIATSSRDGTIRLWETTPKPTGGAADRRIVEIARRVVNERRERLTFVSQIVTSLRSDVTLDAELAKVAIEIATARGDNAYKFNEASRAVVVIPDRDVESYRKALRKAEAACRAAPQSATFRNTFGIAQYRLGQYLEAMATLEQPHEAYAKVERNSHPRDVAFIAMTQHRLGHDDDARRELARLRDLMQDERWAIATDLKAFLREAEQLIEDADGSDGDKE